MKEFDFDELDKAVNSLMGDIKKPAEATPASTPAPILEETPPVAVPSPSPVPAPVPTPVVEQTSPSPPPSTPDTTTPLVPRQGGRFMDVVHPSSDMKTATPPPRSSREGIAMQPLTIANRSTGPAKTFDMVTVAPSTPVREKAPEVPVPNPEAAPTEPEPAPTPPPSDDWTSPFLPGAQVEKRPLGGAAPASSDNGLSESIAAELSKGPSDAATTSSLLKSEPENSAAIVEKSHTEEAKSDKVTMPSPESNEPVAKKGIDLQLNPEVPPPQLPAELNSSLVAIESGRAGETVQGSKPSDTPPAATLLAASSIPTQYTEQPSTGDESHTPIYDNEAAHQPLAHPAKKKKGWLLIIFIVAFLVVGGGLGAAVYFLHLI